MVGDGFLKDNFGTYKSLEYPAFRNKKITQFYMSNYYNVKNFNNLSAVGASARNAMARLINSTIEALNSSNTLPKMLIIIIDKDLIESINLFNYGAYKVLLQVVNWLTRQIDILIRWKRLQILEKRPGAVYNQYHPAVIYVMMLKHPHHFKEGSWIEVVCGLRTKFNAILNDAAARQDAYVLSI